jgi:RNA polymerase sigma-70 factor (ECF subfamily)
LNATSFPDDSLLAHQARAGSSAAFATLVHRYHGRVFAFLFALTRHRQDAEDLTQDTFLRAWRKFGRYDPGQPLLPWLFTLARRQSIAALRKKACPLPEVLPFPEEPAPQDDHGQWLWEVARRDLSPDAYSALWLHYREELCLKEVADVLGKREGAVKVLLHRARKSLAESLRGQKKMPEGPERNEESGPPPLITSQERSMINLLP